jgi:hypothetical protein
MHEGAGQIVRKERRECEMCLMPAAARVWDGITALRWAPAPFSSSSLPPSAPKVLLLLLFLCATSNTRARWPRAVSVSSHDWSARLDAAVVNAAGEETRQAFAGNCGSTK